MPEKLLNVSDSKGNGPLDACQLQKHCELSNGLNLIAQRLLSCSADTIGDALKFAMSSFTALIGSASGIIYLHDKDLIKGESEHCWSTASLPAQRIDPLTRFYKQQLPECPSSGYWTFADAGLGVSDMGYAQGVVLPLTVQSHFNGYIAFSFTGEQQAAWSEYLEYLRTLADMLSHAVRRCRDVQALTVAKERLRVGQIYANIGTWEWDLVTDAVFYSEQILPLLGLSEDNNAMDRQYFATAIHPADRDRIKDAVRRSIDEDALYNIEHRVVWPDGTVRWVLERGAVARDESGRALKLLGTVQDIHEQKLAQFELEDNQRHLKQTQAMAKLGRWTVDLKTGELGVSDEVYDIHGLDPSKDTFTMETGRNAIPPEDYEKLAQMDQQLKDMGHCDLTHRIALPSGEMRHVYVLTWAKKSPEGEFLALDGFIQDITHRVELEAHLRDSERRLAFAIEGVGDAVWDWNITNNTIQYTGLTNTFLGYAPDELPSRIEVLSELLHSEDRDKLTVEHNKCVRGDSEGYKEEMRMRCKDGSYKWILCRATAVEHDQDGTATRLIGIHSDISESKAKEAELISARDEAERANQAKSEFLSHMSHELRTPLNAILGFGQLLQQEHSLSGSHKDNVGEILKAGQHLLGLINEVLDLARVEAGKMAVSIEPVLVNTLLHEVNALVEPLAAEKSIELELTQFDTVAVQADKVRLKQIMINLLSNAIKYNRSGGQVQVSVGQPRPDVVRILVEDTGFGIEKNALEEIFQAFNRYNADGSEIEGTGIGLTLTKALVEMMGGTIGVDSTPEQGSCFWVDLPLADQRDIYEHSAAKPEAATSKEQAANQKTVLYIDDNPVNLKLVRHILGSLPNISVLEADSGKLGVTMAQTLLPDMVLVDINMPDIDGYQVLEILRSRAEFIDKPIIAVTANAMASDIAKGKAAGFSEYLSKPFDIAAFKSVVCDFFKED